LEVAGKQVLVRTGFDVIAAVDHPGRNACLDGLADDFFKLLDFFCGQRAGFLGDVDLGDAACGVRERDADALDFCKRERNGLFAVEVGVQDADQVAHFRDGKARACGYRCGRLDGLFRICHVVFFS
jgi:hypothetical protein